jgi:TonB family protein
MESMKSVPVATEKKRRCFRQMGIFAAFVVICFVCKPVIAQETKPDTLIPTKQSNETSSSQQTKSIQEAKEDVIFIKVEEMPEFPGGDVERIRFIQNNLVYPPSAREEGLGGQVIVGFIVEPDGSITDVKILRGVAKILDDEAIRVVKLMPKWKSGIQRNKPVRVIYQMPITFTITKE